MENVAPELRPAEPSLKDRLYSDTRTFEFHQSVRLLEALRPGCTHLGTDSFPYKEALSLASYPGRDFSGGDIRTLEAPRDPKDLPKLIINFMGLAAANGPLPDTYVQLLLDRLKRRDTAMLDFLDIFNHRLVSILHRIRRKYWIGLASSQPLQESIGSIFYSLLGMHGPHLHDRLGIPDRSLVQYAGLIHQKPHSLHATQRIVQHSFNVPVTVFGNQGQWCPIITAQQSHIGTSGQFQKLGQGFALGKRFWDEGRNILLSMGPMSLVTYKKFLKTGLYFPVLQRVCQYYLGPTFGVRARLHLNKKETPSLQLGQETLLGWTTWLKTKPTETDQPPTLFVLSVSSINQG